MKDKRFLFLLIAAFVRMGFYGFAYGPQLDDYIQYGLYSQFANPWKDAFLRIGLYYSRPLAGIADSFLWCRFWNQLWILLILFTALSAVCCYQLILLLERMEVRTGWMFPVVFLLNPMNLEGVYWISASTRIVVGLFFCLWALLELTKKRYVWFTLLQLVSFCFYEQVVVTSLFFTLFLLPRKKWYLPAMNTLAIGLYYFFFLDKGNVGYKGGFAPNTELYGQIINGLFHPSFFQNAFSRGLNYGSWYLLSAFGIGILLFAYEERIAPCRKKLLLGIGLLLIPFLPFLVIQGRAASLRNFFIPLIGAGLLADYLFDWIGDAKRFVTAALCVVFMVGTISELHDYRMVSEYNQEVINYAAHRIVENQENVIVGAIRYPGEQNWNFGEHILSVASSDWALTGALRERLRNPYLPLVKLEEQTKEDGRNYIVLPPLESLSDVF